MLPELSFFQDDVFLCVAAQKAFHDIHGTLQVEELNKHLLITAKPMVYLVNLKEKSFIKKKNKW